MRKPLFIVGLVVTVIFSAVIGVLNVGVLYFFGIPVLFLIAGIIMIWLSRARLAWRIVSTCISIPIICASFAFWLGINRAEPETFLLPDGFRGEFVIFYDEPCGTDPKYIGGRRIYEIPKSGVLITKFSKDRGLLDRKFFFVSNDGSMREIPEFRRQDYETERKEWNLSHTTPVEDFTKETVGAFPAYGSNLIFVSKNLFGYFVDDYRRFERAEKDHFQERKTFEQRAEDLLKSCTLPD